MNWIKGTQYDYPEGFPHYCRHRTLWWDLNSLRVMGRQDEIPKEFRRRRWVPGTSFFRAEDGTSLEVNWEKVDPIPMRTIRWIFATDNWELKQLKRDLR